MDHMGDIYICYKLSIVVYFIAGEGVPYLRLSLLDKNGYTSEMVW